MYDDIILSLSGTPKGPRKIVFLSEMSHLSEVFLLKRKFMGPGESVSLSKSPYLSGVPVIESILYYYLRTSVIYWHLIPIFFFENMMESICSVPIIVVIVIIKSSCIFTSYRHQSAWQMAYK